MVCINLEEVDIAIDTLQLKSFILNGLDHVKNSLTCNFFT